MPCELLRVLKIYVCYGLSTFPVPLFCFVVFITKNEFCNANKLIGFEMYCLKNSKYKTTLLKL